MPGIELLLQVAAVASVHSEQRVGIGSCAGTATTRLNAEKIIKQCDHKAVVQVFATPANPE